MWYIVLYSVVYIGYALGLLYHFLSLINDCWLCYCTCVIHICILLSFRLRFIVFLLIMVDVQYCWLCCGCSFVVQLVFVLRIIGKPRRCVVIVTLGCVVC